MWPVVGHKRIIEFLETQIKNDNIFHAYLFAGPAFVGKFIIAKFFAQSLLCSNKALDGCPSCQNFSKKMHPDFILVENTDSPISIETIRETKRQISFVPTLSTRKVIIFEEASYLTTEAQNALLKTLEEPPKYAVLILITQKENLLPTIVSRCFQLNFQRLPSKEVKEELLKRGVDKNQAPFLAHLSRGQIGRILKDQSFLEKWENSFETLLNLSSSSTKDKIEYAKNINAEELNIWLGILRDIMFFKINSSFLSDYPPYFLEKISEFSSNYDLGQIQSLILLCQETQELFSTNVNKKLLLENLTLQL